MAKPTSYQLSQDHGMLDINEIDLIKEHVARLPKKSMVINIGAGFGTSTLAMLEVRPTAFIWSIDPNTRSDEITNVKEAGFDGRVVRLLTKSQDINWPKSIKIHCVFVDGGHTEDDVRQDIEIYKPMVRKNGLIYFHDFEHPNYGPDQLMSKVIVKMMSDWELIGKARYLIVYRKD